MNSGKFKYVYNDNTMAFENMYDNILMYLFKHFKFSFYMCHCPDFGLFNPQIKTNKFNGAKNNLMKFV